MITFSCGQLKVVNSRFIGNRCDRTGPDLGGAAIRALSEDRNRPVYIVHSTFTGAYCSNGGGKGHPVVVNSTIS